MTDYDTLFAGAVDQSAGLSEAGRARRESMRAQLTNVVVARRRQRAGMRWGGVLAVVLVAMAAWRIPGSGGRFEAPSRHLVLAHMDYSAVRDDATVLARYAVPATTPSPEVWIDDAKLLELLISAQRPTGLIRTAGRVFVTEDVVDDIGE